MGTLEIFHQMVRTADKNWLFSSKIENHWNGPMACLTDDFLSKAFEIV